MARSISLPNIFQDFPTSWSLFGDLPRQVYVAWRWEDGEEKAFSEVKHLVTQAPILGYYGPDKELVIQCDASSRGLGSVLQEGRLLAYASRALTGPETRYATFEEEMLVRPKPNLDDRKLLFSSN